MKEQSDRDVPAFLPFRLGHCVPEYVVRLGVKGSVIRLVSARTPRLWEALLVLVVLVLLLSLWRLITESVLQTRPPESAANLRLLLWTGMLGALAAAAIVGMIQYWWYRRLSPFAEYDFATGILLAGQPPHELRISGIKRLEYVHGLVVSRGYNLTSYKYHSQLQAICVTKAGQVRVALVSMERFEWFRPARALRRLAEHLRCDYVCIKIPTRSDAGNVYVADIESREREERNERTPVR